MVHRDTWPRPSLGDGLLAGGILLVEGFAAARLDTAAEAGVTGVFGVPVLGWVLLVVGSSAVLGRRRRPLAVLAVVVLAYVVWHLVGYVGSPSLTILVAMYGVGRYVEHLMPAIVAPLTATAVIAIVGLIDGDTLADLALAVVVVPLLPWYIGRRVAARREHVGLLEERAAYLERERAAEIRLALDEERRSIARELHDVVAHRVSLMTVQAGAAQAILDNDPSRALQAMEAVEHAGRTALDELRHLLDVLRPEPGEQPRTPAASLADLPQLASQMEEAGLGVHLEFDGLPPGIPTTVDLSAFRIVQESLTNALRHAGPGARATVRLEADDRELRLTVADDGQGGSGFDGGSGRGLAGMRERAELLGGSLEAGRFDQRGFQVRAAFPLTGPRP